MFGSRDVWFVVGLPVFLYAHGWHYMEVAGFLASWTIGYGRVQALAPYGRFAAAPTVCPVKCRKRGCGAPCSTAIPARPRAAGCKPSDRCRLDLCVVTGLGFFGFAFAVMSSLHSYLILAYAGSAKAAEDVGFYYAANAAGRLAGILLSGALMQAGGLQACLWGSATMLALCLTLTFLLPTTAAARRVPA